jgi:hypothetical protein
MPEADQQPTQATTLPSASAQDRTVPNAELPQTQKVALPPTVEKTSPDAAKTETELQTRKVVQLLTSFFQEHYTLQHDIIAGRKSGWTKQGERKLDDISAEHSIAFSKQLGEMLRTGGFDLAPFSADRPTLDSLIQGLLKYNVFLQHREAQATKDGHILILDSVAAHRLDPETKTFVPPKLQLKGVMLPVVPQIEYKEAEGTFIDRFQVRGGNHNYGTFIGTPMNTGKSTLIIFNSPEVEVESKLRAMPADEIRRQVLVNESAHIAAAALPYSKLPRLQLVGRVRTTDLTPLRIDEALSDLASIRETKSGKGLALELERQFQGHDGYAFCRELSARVISAFAASPYAENDREKKSPLISAQVQDDVLKRGQIGSLIAAIKENPAAFEELKFRLDAEYDRMVGNAIKVANKVAAAETLQKQPDKK